MTERRKPGKKVAAYDPMDAINTFTLIREQASALALATVRYRRRRQLLTATRLSSLLLDGSVPTDPDFTEERNAFREAGRELRPPLCYLADDFATLGGTVLLVATRKICGDGGGSAEEFSDIAELLAAWHACERLFHFADLIPGQQVAENVQIDFEIPSDAQIDTIIATVVMLLACLRDYLKSLGFDIPGE